MVLCTEEMNFKQMNLLNVLGVSQRKERRGEEREA